MFDLSENLKALRVSRGLTQAQAYPSNPSAVGKTASPTPTSRCCPLWRHFMKPPLTVFSAAVGRKRQKKKTCTFKRVSMRIMRATCGRLMKSHSGCMTVSPTTGRC